jgi:hypothetical protein
VTTPTCSKHVPLPGRALCLSLVAALGLCFSTGALAEEAPSPISIAIVVEGIQPAGLTPACTVRIGYQSTGGAIVEARLSVDGVDVTACSQVYQEGIVYVHPAELAAGDHSVSVWATDEGGNSSTTSQGFAVQPYAGQQSLRLGVAFSGDVNAAGLLSSITNEAAGLGLSPETDASSNLSVTTAATLAGRVAGDTAVDIAAGLTASTDTVALGDLQAGVGNRQLQANLGRYTLDYGELTVQGMSARSALVVGPAGGPSLRVAPRDRDWEVFALRTDSGASGGLGGEDRYDRWGYGGRHSFSFGRTAASLSAARVWDAGSATATPGSYASAQASTSVGLIVSSQLGKAAGTADLSGELAWSTFDGDPALGTDGGSGLAYNLQIAGGKPALTWTARAFDVPTDYFTLGNPFLTTGHRGVEASLGTTLASGVTAQLAYADRTEQFLLGGLTGLTGVPASDVTDWTLTSSWGDGVAKPAITASGSWASRGNSSSGTDQVDQSERTLTLGVTKAWKGTAATTSVSDYSLSDGTDGTASVDTRQVAATLRQALGKYTVGATYSRSSNDLGTPSHVRSWLLGADATGPLFTPELQATASYLRARNYDALGTVDASDEEYRLQLRYAPAQARSIWQQLLAALALEGRILTRDDPTLVSGHVRTQEVRLVTSTTF